VTLVIALVVDIPIAIIVTGQTLDLFGALVGLLIFDVQARANVLAFSCERT